MHSCPCRSDLLLSACIDCTVRLWHVVQGVCLGEFRHPKIVTAVDFHPLTDAFFLTGCLDKASWRRRSGGACIAISIYFLLQHAMPVPSALDVPFALMLLCMLVHAASL